MLGLSGKYQYKKYTQSNPSILLESGYYYDYTSPIAGLSIDTDKYTFGTSIISFTCSEYFDWSNTLFKDKYNNDINYVFEPGFNYIIKISSNYAEILKLS